MACLESYVERYEKGYKDTYMRAHMELVASIGADRESWGQLSALIAHGTWEKVILIRSNTVEGFPLIEGIEEIVADTTLPLLELKAHLAAELKPRLSELDACVSIASGNGKEHMALISALLSIPTGIRFVAFTKQGVEVIN